MRKTKDYTFFFSKHDVFSNWHPSPFTVRGISFNCVEQMMMYAKALEFGDRQTAEKILQEPEPKRQKALGRQVANYDDARWKAISRNIVYAACKAKFTQNPHLLHALMQTTGTTLVEASPYDTLWGVGLGANDPKIEDPRNWRGKNWLGQVLTRLREDLTAEPGVSSSPGPKLLR